MDKKRICPKCSSEKEENKACLSCGFINKDSSAVPLYIEQYFTLPIAKRNTTDYTGICPLCKGMVLSNKCQRCLFVGNIFAVQKIEELVKKMEGGERL